MIIFFKKYIENGCVCSSVVEDFPSTCKALGQSPSPTRKGKS